MGGGGGGGGSNEPQRRQHKHRSRNKGKKTDRSMKTNQENTRASVDRSTQATKWPGGGNEMQHSPSETKQKAAALGEGSEKEWAKAATNTAKRR